MPDQVKTITSTQNMRIKALMRLYRKSGRRETGQTLVEGRYELSVALDSEAPVYSLFYCPDFIADGDLSLLEVARRRGAEVFELSAPVFQKASYRDNPDGWLAVMGQPETRLEALSLPANPLLLVCAAVEKPGNLGAMLRTADAAGVDAVVSTEPVTDWGNPNIVRASRGTVFTVPVAEATPEQLLAWLRERGVTLLATSPDGDVAYTAADLAGPVAILLGSEQDGLSDEWLAAADQQVFIPMSGKVNSLNVATSAALLVYEALRQRAQA